jgi:hypothetical protein
LEFLRQLVDLDKSGVMLVLCTTTIVIFVLLLVLLLRGRKLRKRVDALQVSIQTLAKAEDNRLHKERRGQTKLGSPE